MEAKAWTYRLLDVGGETAAERVFDWGIMTLIVANVAAVILSTVTYLYTQYQSAFRAFKAVSVVIFSTECVGRIWSATAADGYDRAIVGRVRYALRPMVVVDLLAILPFYLGAFFIDLRFLRALRLFRFFRLFKLARYSESVRSFRSVLTDKREEFVISMSVTGLLLVLSSSMMYYFERSAQPEKFSSIPEAFWWGVVTLTTVGYGDVYPVTAGGRVFGAIIAFLGVGLFALPASILASGFIEAADGSTESEEFGSESATDPSGDTPPEPTYCPHCGERLDKD
jgi:voltage-gated potassium channel